jgi:outer membrane protein assembly factor BamB
VFAGWKRYYSGVVDYLTTICCSLALSLLLSAGVRSDGATPALPLFPVRVAWSVALSATAAPAGFGTDRVVIPLQGDRLAAFDLRSGAPLWEVPGRSEAAPVVDGPLLFALDGAALVAYRSDTGQQAWRTILSAQPAAGFVSHAGWLLAPLDTGTLVAYRAADGMQIWARDIGAVAHAPPTIEGDRIFVPTRDGTVVAVAVLDGSLVWQRRLGGAAQQVGARDGRLYVGSLDNYFYSLNAANGDVYWRWRTGADIVGAPAIDDDRVYFVSLDNVLRGLDRRNGAQRWRRALAARPSDGPVLAAGTVLVWGVSGSVQAFAKDTGAPAGELTTGGPLAASLHLIERPLVPLPTIVRVSRSLEGSQVAAFVRDVEPALAPVAPLPNAVPVGPLDGEIGPEAATATDGQASADRDR